MSDDPHQEDDYRESEDEDYNPDKAGVDDDDVNHSGSESEEDEKEQKIPAAEVSAVDTSEKRQTRSQQLAQARDQPITIEKSTSGIDIDSLWASMNSSKPPAKTASPTTTDPATEPANGPIPEEYITIKRTIKFAGKVTHEEKRVLASSAEGKAYLKEQQEPVKPARKQPPRKRKSSLLEELESGKAKKINTLEKSRLDWLGFVDKEGIREDLTKHNKGGYLHKQDFLSRVEHKIHDDMTANKKKKP